jgi:hypothetical protein
LNLLDDLALAREASLFFFREEHAVVGSDDEDAAAAANELAVISQSLLDLGRQTGGPWEIVSDAAVIDSNVHVRSF